MNHLQFTVETFTTVVSHYQDAIPAHIRDQVKFIAFAIELNADFRDTNIVMKKSDFEDLCNAMGFGSRYEWMYIDDKNENNIITIQKSSY